MWGQPYGSAWVDSWAHQFILENIEHKSSLQSPFLERVNKEALRTLLVLDFVQASEAVIFGW